MVLVDLCAYCRYILNETTVRGVHLSQKFLIVITENKQNIVNTLDEIFAILWANGLIDSHVLIQSDEHIWSFFTYLPYQEDCFKLNHHKLISFTSDNFSKNFPLSLDQLYPKKLKNFKKCPLHVAVSILPPLTIDPNNCDEPTHFRGIDISMMNYISKSLNFTVVFKAPPSGTGHGIVYTNGTATDNLDLVNIFYKHFILLFQLP